MSFMKSLSWLFLSLACCYGAAAIGAAFPPGEWYLHLQKPAFNPPAWVFGPAWTLLYTLMAFSWWRILRHPEFRKDHLAHGLFLLQLGLNAAWSWLFFGLHRPGWAFAEICLLLLAILATQWRFARHDRLAAGLLVPYALWVTFATVLNATLWRMNA